MQITYTHLADLANKTIDGKVNIIGVFEVIAASAVPCQHPMISLVFGVKADPHEKGRAFPLHICLLDGDGRTVWTAPGLTVTVPRQVSSLRSTESLIFNLVNLAFPDYGLYRFELEVKDSNGDSAAQSEACLEVVRFAAAPGSAGTPNGDSEAGI